MTEPREPTVHELGELIGIFAQGYTRVGRLVGSFERKAAQEMIADSAIAVFDNYEFVGIEEETVDGRVMVVIQPGYPNYATTYIWEDGNMREVLPSYAIRNRVAA